MRYLLTPALAILAALAMYAHWPRTGLPEGVTADRVVVLKSERRLQLYRGEQLLMEYRVSLGFNPVGTKEIEGDGKTPEGPYFIDKRNPKSQYHLSLHISYPTAKQVAQASAWGVNPGGLIMIHGLPNGLGAMGRLHLLTDWTAGCIAVTNEEIEEIWRAVPNGTPIEVKA
jgi:murein L,D-transpeptidase YafK